MAVARWFGRILGLLIVGLVLLIAIGERFDPTALSGTELAMSVVLLVPLGGMLTLWKWEGVGGLLVIAGMSAFFLINYSVSGRFPSGFVFPTVFSPGVLALVCWWHQRRKTGGQQES